MPTVIDALIVTLDLDPKNFTQGQQQALAQLRNFQKDAERSAKNIEDTTRKVTQFFSSMRSSAVGLFSVILGASGLEEMARRIVTSASSIDKLSNRFDVSASFVSKFGNVVKQVGGNVEEAQGFINQLGDALSAANVGQYSDLFVQLQNVGLLPGVGNILAGGPGHWDIEGLVKNLGAAFERASPNIRNQIARMLPITPGLFEAFRQPGFAGRLGAAPGIDKKLAEASQRLVESFTLLQERLTIVAANMLDDLLPALKQFADLLDKITLTTGKQLLDKLGLGFLTPPEKAAPAADVPGFLRRHGLPGLADFLEKGGVDTIFKSPATEEEKNYRKGIDMLKKGLGTPTGTSSSLGSIPLARLANIPGFRVTSTTGGQHAGGAHGEGRAMDFVVDPRFYDQVIAELKKEGLKAIDARTPDSRFWTGPHIHLEFATRAAMERFQAGQGGGSHTENSSEMHIGEINVHAPSGNASDITKSITQTLRRTSYSDSADTGME